MHDEDRLKEKLRAIEALFAGATTDGERAAAENARMRISARINELQQDRLVEWQFSLDPWSYRLLVGLARRYGLKPYRYRRQRHSTLVVKAPERFLRETFLPAYNEMSKALHEHLSAVADRVVKEVLSADESEPGTVDSEPKLLEAVSSLK